ncbi:hypothetical protein FACS189437_02620 [Bacteroidia bacterium]|nr:hypothetical protein FACS189437_02620 [Bacteroidia bacterium]
MRIKLFHIYLEEDNNVYIEDYVIPRGRENIDIKARENVVWAMLGRWLSKNPLKRKKNADLEDFIYLRFDGMQETVNKAARKFNTQSLPLSLWNKKYLSDLRRRVVHCY